MAELKNTSSGDDMEVTAFEKPFVIIKISGISGDIVSGDIRSFTTPDDGLIDTVEIMQTDDMLDGLRLTLKGFVSINDHVIEEILNKARTFVVNIYGKLQPCIYKFGLELGQVYDSKAKQEETLTLCSTITFSENITMTRGHGITLFEGLFNKQSVRPDADDIYMLLFNIMGIDNIVTRYLMQYELLLSLVAQKRTQREAIKYILTVYNPTKSFDYIGTHPTRKPGYNYDEDDITYYRNLLGHNDALESVDDKSISRMCNALTEVIFFALNNGSEAK